MTSATIAFKENFDFDDDDEKESRRTNIDENLREPVDENQFHPNSKVKNFSNQKQNPVTQIDFFSGEKTSTNQQDDWEDFIDGRHRSDQIRLKLNRNFVDEDQSQDDDDDEQFNNGHNERLNNENHQNIQKDKPVWKFHQIQTTNEEKTNETPAIVVQDEIPMAKPTGVYQPPQKRSYAGQTSAVTIVSGIHQRTTKKDKPNLASTEDFPTLGKTMKK